MENISLESVRYYCPKLKKAVTVKSPRLEFRSYLCDGLYIKEAVAELVIDCKCGETHELEISRNIVRTII